MHFLKKSVMENFIVCAVWLAWKRTKIFIKWKSLSRNILIFNPSHRNNPGRREKNQVNFLILACLCGVLHKTFWDTTKKCQDKNLTLFLSQYNFQKCTKREEPKKKKKSLKERNLMNERIGYLRFSLFGWGAWRKSLMETSESNSKSYLRGILRRIDIR